MTPSGRISRASTFRLDRCRRDCRDDDRLSARPYNTRTHGSLSAKDSDPPYFPAIARARIVNRVSLENRGRYEAIKETPIERARRENLTGTTCESVGAVVFELRHDTSTNFARSEMYVAKSRKKSSNLVLLPLRISLNLLKEKVAFDQSD